MKLLQMCKDMFNEYPNQISIKEFFRQQRKKENEKINEDDNTDKGFFILCCNYLGGRGYNEFLDYSLFAIKLNYIFGKYRFDKGADFNWKDVKEAIIDLLMDDRHDMYQNIPCGIEEMLKDSSKEIQSKVYSDIVDSLIDCVNTEGTGNISHTFNIKEK